MASGNEHHENHLGCKCIGESQARSERADKKAGGADINRTQYGHQADQIEPRRDPANADISKDRTSVIAAARRRVCRGNLRQAQCENKENQATDGPTDADGAATCAADGLPEGIDAAGKNTNDGK